MLKPQAFALLLFTFVLSLGCGRTSESVSPTTAEVQAPLSTMRVGDSVGQSELVLGLYRIRVAADQLNVTVEPMASPTRQASGPQGDVFDLDLGLAAETALLNTSGMWQATSIQFIDGDLQITFLHEHPIAAPDWGQPITTSNRADLSYTARAVFLNDTGDAHTFVGALSSGANAICGNPGALVNPDGFVFLDLSAGNEIVGNGPFGSLPEDATNTFPYLLLADEAKNNRIGVSNGGDLVDGNYDSLRGGWQQHNSGISNDSWTGFDAIHAGQTTEVKVVIAAEALLAHSFSLDVALLGKYSIPHHLVNIDYRIPPPETFLGSNVASDPGPGSAEGPLDHWFAYRMPHGALDVSKIKLENDPTPLRLNSEASPLSWKVRDWDAIAVEAPVLTPLLYNPDAPLGVQPVAIDRVAIGTADSSRNIPAQIPQARLFLEGLGSFPPPPFPELSPPLGSGQG